MRTMAERDAENPAALWIVTRGVHEAVAPSALRQSFLWGLAGVIAAEHPELWGGLVDIAVDTDLGTPPRRLPMYFKHRANRFWCCATEWFSPRRWRL